MEHWKFDHPALGCLEVATGTNAELQQLDPNFPAEAEEPEKKRRENKKHRATKRSSVVDKLSTALETRVVVLQDSVPVARLKMQVDRKVKLAARGQKPKPEKDGEYSSQSNDLIVPGGASLHIRTNAFDRDIVNVKVKNDKTIVFFDPPVGSFAADRERKMEKSPVRRWLYPLLGGMGKSGWAIFALVILPLIGKILDPVIDWLISLIPDFELPLPDINWPSIPWPEINWPSIPWPSISLPTLPTLPELPWWLEWMLSHPKIWVPIIIGIVVGIITIRNAKKSRQQRIEWQRERLAGDLRALVEKKRMH